MKTKKRMKLGTLDEDEVPKEEAVVDNLLELKKIGI